MNNWNRKLEKYLGIGGSAISLIGLGYNLWKTFSTRDLNPTQVYSIPEVSRILRITQEETMKLIYDGKISARQVGGKYEVIGSNIMSFLNA